MTKPQRKPRSQPKAKRRRHLKLVSKPRRRRWKVGSIRKPKYTPELLHYEEEIVLEAIREMGGRATLGGLCERWPGRFRQKQLWFALVRLAEARRVQTPAGLGLYHDRDARRPRQSGFFVGLGRNARAWYERHQPQSGREFWL